MEENAAADIAYFETIDVAKYPILHGMSSMTKNYAMNTQIQCQDEKHSCLITLF